MESLPSWPIEERLMLCTLAHQHGTSDWSLVAKAMRQQCGERAHHLFTHKVSAERSCVNRPQTCARVFAELEAQHLAGRKRRSGLAAGTAVHEKPIAQLMAAVGTEYIERQQKVKADAEEEVRCARF